MEDRETIRKAAEILTDVLDCLSVDILSLSTKQSGGAMDRLIKGLRDYYIEKKRKLKN